MEGGSQRLSSRRAPEKRCWLRSVKAVAAAVGLVKVTYQPAESANVYVGNQDQHSPPEAERGGLTRSRSYWPK